MRITKTILSALFLILASITRGQEVDWPKASPDAVTHWQSLRFGMFIHWGPVSLTEKELSWSRGSETPVEVYDRLYHQFNPTQFNADEWVAIAKAAGMKYIVFVSKHHDGFCLWDTKYTDYNITNTPLHRDVLKELSVACKKQGISLGCYYSVPDVHYPNWPTTKVGGGGLRDKYDLDDYERYLENQTTELIRNYGPLLTIWNDMDSGTSSSFYGKRGANTIKLARRLQPDILVDDRTGDGGDYDTPEQRVGAFQIDRPWESCMTVSAHGHWSWGGTQDGVKSPATCIGMLVRCAGGDGNMLLDVGPRPDGIIDPAQALLLKQIGGWMARYGESIYGTRGGPYKPTGTYVSTRRGDVIYLHILNTMGGDLTLPPLPACVVSASVLGGGKVEVRSVPDALTIITSDADPTQVDTVIKLVINQNAMEIAPIGTGMSATASNVFQNDPNFSADKAIDGDSGTRWATDDGVKTAWLQIDFLKPREIGSVSIDEWGGRVTQFAVEYKEAGEWKPIITGTGIGGNFSKSFTPIKVQSVRLDILDASAPPTINEIRFE